MMVNMELARKRHASPVALERGRKRRVQIVEAATHLFAKAGYRGTALADIAAEVGVTQAGLLHHFDNKENLLEAVVRRRSEQDAPLIAEIIGDGGLEMLDRLPKLAEHNTKRAGLSQLFTILVAEALLPDNTAKLFFVSRYRNLRSTIVAALQVGQKRGEIRADVDLRAVAKRIVAALDGLQLQWLLDPRQVNLVDAYRELGQSLRLELQA
jgi:AcrR family transcriptional regulator